MIPPQPSPTKPQVAPAAAQVRGVHIGAPHWLATPPPPQVCPAEQVPQLMLPPQPSPIVPQVAPAMAQVILGQDSPVAPHLNGTPSPPQVSGAAQVPQFTVPPQPSGASPQVAPIALHAIAPAMGTQADG